MTDITHAAMTDTDGIHQPKGASTAEAGSFLGADGAGGTAWSTEATINLGENYIQVPAATMNPAGASPAVLDDIGITVGLRFSNGSERVAAFNVALPPSMDYTEAPDVRIGFASTETGGNVYLSVKYQWLTADSDISSTTSSEVLAEAPVSSTANGYTYQTFALSTPDVTDRVCAVRITRYGDDSLDTNTGNLYLLGALLTYTAEVGIELV